MSVCALAADTKVETPEGPMAIRAVAGKSIAVFARSADGRIRFRLMRDVRKVAEQQPVLTIALDNGQTLRVAPEQVLLKKGRVECRADALQVGDWLEAAFHFPEGYVYRNEVTGAAETSRAAWRVTRLDAGSRADLYTLKVHDSEWFVFTAGVLGRAEPTAVA